MGELPLAKEDMEVGLEQAAQLFGLLAEPARLKILRLLRDGSMCGRELARDLDLTPATTCHHIEKLKTANLLSEKRSGRRVYYSIMDTELIQAVGRSLAALENSIPSARRRETAVNSKAAGRQKANCNKRVRAK